MYLGNVVKKSALLGFSRRIKIHSIQEVEEIGEAHENCKWLYIRADSMFKSLGTLEHN